MSLIRIAVVADIHANVFALREFLAAIAEQEVACVLCAGDLVGVGPHPREVAETVFEDSRFRMVAGNNEEALAEASLAPEGTNRHRLWTLQRLGKDLGAKVMALPRSRIDELEGLRILTLHARPGSSSELPLLYQRRSLREFWADYSAEEPDVVIFGHTHEPFLLRHERRLFVNPGALGLSPEGVGSFCLLTLQGGRADVEFRSVPWNRESVARDMLRRDVPDKEYILERFFGLRSVD